MRWSLPRGVTRHLLHAVASVVRLANSAGLRRRQLSTLDLEQLDQHARALLAQGRDADMERLYSSAWQNLKYFPTATFLQDVVQVLRPLPQPVPDVPALMLLSVNRHDAAANLNRLGQEQLGGEYDLTVVDVADDPERAEAARILTTPTLVKEAPGQPRRVTGDLSDAERVFVALGL